MIERTEGGLQVKPPPKELNGFYKGTGDYREQEHDHKKIVDEITSKIGSSEELIRNDSTYKGIQEIMHKVFGEMHMGILRPIHVLV